jgi:CYTH domain-containing protein
MVTDASRLEFEYPIPLADAEQMLAQVCPAAMEKIRRRVTVGAHVWEVDEFFGDNAGLVLAEVELQDEAEPFERPAWLGAEVTADGRYTNAHLSQHPYSRWPQGHTTQDAHS